MKRERHSESLRAYFREIGRISILSRDEELSLARRATDGDRSAADALMKANLRFVVKVAMRYQGNGVPLDDLVGEGNLGLMRAIEMYDPDRGVRFLSYAVWWIKQAVRRAVRKQSEMIRIPERWESADADADAASAANGADQAHRSGPTDGSSSARARDRFRVVSLDVPVGDDAETAPLSEFVVDESRPSVDATALSSWLRTDVVRGVDELSERERTIINERYGLETRAPETLFEVANKHSLTKERIRQIEKSALRKLRGSDTMVRLRGCLAG